MAHLAVLERDPLSRARLSMALQDEHELTFVHRWKELRKLILERDVEGCVVDLHGTRAPDILERLEQLREDPGLPLVVYSDFRGREPELYQLGRMGVSAVVLSDQNDSARTLRGAVQSSLAQSVASRTLRELRGRVPTEVLPLVRWAVEQAHEAPRTEDMARSFGLSPESLNRRLRSAGLPTAGRLLVWGKLLRAARWLEERDRSAEAVAHRLGYASGSTFRRSLKRYTGATPREVTRRGGLAFVIDAFLEEGFPE